MLQASRKKDTDTKTMKFLLHKDKKENMENATARNSTFASPDTQTDTSACKRAVFLPTLQTE